MDWRKKVRAWLREQERSQEWLAGELGVSKAAVGHWLTGERGITLEHAKRLASMIGIPLSEVLESSDATLLTDEEVSLLAYWRTLPKDQRDALLRLLGVDEKPAGN